MNVATAKALAQELLDIQMGSADDAKALLTDTILLSEEETGAVEEQIDLLTADESTLRAWFGDR